MALSERWHLRIFNLRLEEAGLAGYFFLHHFFLGLGQALVYTTAYTLFLSSYEAIDLSLVFCVSSIVLMLTGRGYAMLEHHLDIKKFLPLVSLILVLFVVALRALINWMPENPSPFILMVAFQMIYLLSNLKFWGLSALVFDVRQSKRLFSFISSGDVPAKLLGYASVAVLVPVIGIHNLLWFAAVAFAASYLMLRKILEEVSLPEAQHSHHAAPEVQVHFPTSNRRVLYSFFGNDLVLSLSLMAFIFTIVFTSIDFAFLSDVQEKFHTEEQLAKFLGAFFALGYAITTVTKLLFTGRIAEYMGVTRTLLLLPVLLLFFIGVYLISGLNEIGGMKNVAFVGLLYMGSSVLRYSIYDPMYLVLFQPLSSMLRLKGHTIIKGLIQPIALGLTGIAIYLVECINGHLPFYELAMLIGFMCAVWVASVFLTRTRYRKVLRRALEKRFISGADLPLADPEVYELFERKLSQKLSAEETLYIMNLLQRNSPERLKPHLFNLISGGNHLIVQRCMEILVEDHDTSLNKSLYQLIEESKDSRTVACAIRAYCRLEYDAANQLSAMFASQDDSILIALLSGLLNSHNQEGRLRAEQFLLDYLAADDERKQLIALRSIPEGNHPVFSKPLLALLQKAQPAMVNEVVRACGKNGNELFIADLVQLLAVRENRREAMTALVHIGEPAIESLRERFRRGKMQHKEAIQVIRICERIAGREALHLLLTIAESDNFHLRLPAVNAMAVMPHHFDHTLHDRLHVLLEEELSFSAYLLVAQEAAELSPALTTALIFESDNCSRRIFSLLGLLYDNQVISRAASALRQARKEQKANALEALENHIPRKIHERLSILYDNLPLDVRISRLKKYLPEQGPFDPVAVLLMEGTSRYTTWTICCALRSLEKENSNYRLCVHYLGHLEPMLADIAAEMVLQYQHNPPSGALPELMQLNIPDHMKQEQTERLSTLEKVFILKQTRLFADTPENIIAEIVPIVKEVKVQEQDRIFQKGDSGSSMYIIYDGHIRIHDGDKTFAQMGKGDFFGELALLDPEPRSASATALSDCLLLKLDEEDAYDLMEERVEVLRGILQILCRRIRAQNVKMMAAAN